jgi:endonuclease/exonuclease/phosphatase family metal-dependent hydrolase
MKRSHHVLRVATYNIHKYRGLDRRVRPERILNVLKHINADIIALQEVLSIEGGNREWDQLRFLADGLGFHFAFGETRRLKGGGYGNVVRSRFPIRAHRHYDISKRGREPRCCLRTDSHLSASTLYAFKVHFGTAFFEHRQQARRLFEEEMVCHGELKGPRIVPGDFNEWMRDAITRTALGE